MRSQGPAYVGPGEKNCGPQLGIAGCVMFIAGRLACGVSSGRGRLVRRRRCRAIRGERMRGRGRRGLSAGRGRREAPFIRVDLLLRTNYMHELVQGVFPEESGNGPGWRERLMHGKSIKCISGKIYPAGANQVRTPMNWPWRAGLRKWIGLKGRFTVEKLLHFWPCR